MARLTRFLWISLLVLLLANSAMAATVTIQYDGDASAATGCDHLRVYYCYGTGCTPQAEVGTRFPATAGDCSALDQQLVFNLKIEEQFVPGTMCFRVTVVNTSLNESPGVTSCPSVTKAP